MLANVADLDLSNINTPDDLEKAARDAVGFNELGVSGLRRYGNWVTEEWLPDLAGQKAIKVYREMRDNDPVIGAVMFAIEQLIRSVAWREEPFDSSPEAEEAATFLGECREDLNISWEDLMTEILSFLVYGWSWFEIVYKRRAGSHRDPKKNSRYSDNKIGWRKIAFRSQDTLNGWVFDDTDGGLVAMKQLAPPKWEEVEIPLNKSLLFRTTAFKGSPEGRSILRNAYLPFFIKRRIQDFEAIGIERDLAGMPIVYVPPEILRANASPEEKALLAKMRQLVQNVKRDVQEGIIFPLEYDKNGNERYRFELLTSGGARQFDTTEIIQRYDQRIAMTVLADFVLLGTQDVGSWALSKDKTNLFGVAIGSWLDQVAAVFNKHAIPRLMEANGFDMEKLPTLEHGDVQDIDLTALADFISKLSMAGMPMFPDEDLEARLRELAHLPEKSEEAMLMQQQQREMEMEMGQEELYGQQVGNDAAFYGSPFGAQPPQTGWRRMDPEDPSGQGSKPSGGAKKPPGR